MRVPETQRDSVVKLSQSNGSNFFASGLRQKVDQLMNILWAGGVNNPMDSIEQLSYLIFLRLLSERDEQAALIEKGYQRIFSNSWARYAWGNFVTLTGNELFDTLRAAIEKFPLHHSHFNRNSSITYIKFMRWKTPKLLAANDLMTCSNPCCIAHFKESYEAYLRLFRQ